MSKAATATTAKPDKRARTLITPEGLALPLTLASRGARAGALIIDMVIIVIGLIAFQWVMQELFKGVVEGIGFDPQQDLPGSAEFLVITSVLIGFAAWYGYFLVQELGPRGATLGKRLVGIRIAARGGARLTPEAVIARNLLRDIEVFYPLVALLIVVGLSSQGEDVGALGIVLSGWLLLFMLFPFFNRDGLRAGDIVAGTWVVERPRTRLAAVLSTQGAATAEGASEVTGVRYDFGDAELSIYGERELQTLERLLRDSQPDALKAVHATICRKIGWDPGAGDERAFLEAFYAQLRSRLEADMRFGKRKADKFS